MNASMTLSFKFLLLSRSVGFEICSAHKCIHNTTVHRRVWHLKTWRSVQCTAWRSVQCTDWRSVQCTDWRSVQCTDWRSVQCTDWRSVQCTDWRSVQCTDGLKFPGLCRLHIELKLLNVRFMSVQFVRYGSKGLWNCIFHSAFYIRNKYISLNMKTLCITSCS
jgi:hypothetical protein